MNTYESDEQGSGPDSSPSPSAPTPQSAQNAGWVPPTSPKSRPFPEPPDHGIHNWIPKAAWWCKRMGMTAEAAIKKIEAYHGKLRRAFQVNEIAEGVAKAYGPSCTSTSGSPATPKWPALDPKAREHALKTSPVKSVAELTACSHPIPDDLVAERVVDMLFPGNPLLCIGGEIGIFATGPREDFRGTLEDASFMVPSPMSALEGKRKKDGKLSAHTEENTEPRMHIVVESDGGDPHDVQAALIVHLGHFAPLVSVCSSGSKSLHAVYNVAGHPEADVLKFFKYAVALGADSAHWSRSQFCRIPGGWNVKTDKFQVPLYLAPGYAWAALPAPPEVTDEGFQWNLRSGADLWTNNPQKIHNLSDPSIIEGLLREREVASVIGAAKTAKTWFTLALALAVALGQRFLGKISTQCKVLYLDYELKDGTFIKRMCMLSESRPENFLFRCLRGCSRLPTIDEIAALIEAEGIGLLVIDSLYRTGWLSEENNNDTTSRELTVLQHLAARTGCTILTVDHTAKGGGNERSAVDAARGASAKGGFYDALLVLRETDKGGDPDATYAILDPVLRDWPRPKDLQMISFTWKPYCCVVACAGEVSRDDSNRLEIRILEWLGECGDSMSVNQMIEALKEKETTLRKVLAKLVSGGNLIREQKPGHSQRWFYRLPVPEENPAYPTDDASASEGTAEVPANDIGGEPGQESSAPPAG